MNNRYIGINAVIKFYFALAILMAIMAITEIISSNTANLFFFCAGSIILSLLGYGLFKRHETTRKIALVFTWLNLIALLAEISIDYIWLQITDNINIDFYDLLFSVLACVLNIIIIKILGSKKTKGEFTPNKSFKPTPESGAV